jgi:hypothetical protein
MDLARGIGADVLQRAEALAAMPQRHWDLAAVGPAWHP